MRVDSRRSPRLVHRVLGDEVGHHQSERGGEHGHDSQSTESPDEQGSVRSIRSVRFIRSVRSFHGRKTLHIRKTFFFGIS